MTTPHDDLAPSGRHRGPQHSEPSGQEVRAEEARDPQNPPPAARRAYQVERDETARLTRIRALPGEGHNETERGVGPYSTDADLSAAFEEMPAEGRFVVFEDTRTGEIVYQPEGDVTAGWSGMGNFDQVTIFEDQTAAAAYVEERRRSRGGA